MKKQSKKTLKRVLAAALCACLVSVMAPAGGVAKVQAEDLATMVGSPDNNLALGCTATTGYTLDHAGHGGECDLKKLTDGDFENGNVYAGGMENGWYQIDLGKYYTPDSIDEIVFAYNETNPETWPSKDGGYTIAYSKNGLDFEEVKHVTGISIPEVSPYTDAQDVRDITSVTLDAVRYVRVTYPDAYTWGVQLHEFAVLSIDGVKTEVEVEQLVNPADVTVRTRDFGSITYTITGAPGHDEYVYDVYLDETKLIGENVRAGQEYTVKGIASGEHTLKVISVYNGMVSDGIVSDPVTVTGLNDLFNKELNLAKGKTVTATTTDPNEQGGNAAVSNASNLTDVDTKTYWCSCWPDNLDAAGFSAEYSDHDSVVIDLGQTYSAGDISDILIQWRTKTTLPEKFSVEFSETGVEGTYTPALNAMDSCVDESTESNDTALTIPILYSLRGLSGTVQYVRINFTGTKNYGYQVYEIGVIKKDEHMPLEPVEQPVTRGYQMNTDASNPEAVAYESPAFRIVTSFKKNDLAVPGVKYGIIFGKASLIGDNDLTIENADSDGALKDAMINVPLTDESKVTVPDGDVTLQYCALTLKNNGENASAFTTDYLFRSYVIAGDEAPQYGVVSPVNIKQIAESLYTNKLAGSEEAHNYLYDNVLNVVHIDDNVERVLGALRTTLSDETLFKDVGKGIFEILQTHVQNYNQGSRSELNFSELNPKVQDKGITIENFLQENDLYYTVKEFPAAEFAG